MEVPVLEEFAVEKRRLLGLVDSLSKEKLSSQQAFETYRERAKISLLKMSSELKCAEENFILVSEKLKVFFFPKNIIQLIKCYIKIDSKSKLDVLR